MVPQALKISHAPHTPALLLAQATPSIETMKLSCIVSAVDSIPYDSSLVLGNIIDPSRIGGLKTRADLQKKVDAAEDKYQATLRNKLSFDMDLSETSHLGVFDVDGNDPALKKIQDAAEKARQAVKDALGQKVDAQVAYQVALMEHVSESPQTTFGDEPESPIKWSNSKLEYLDISSDTMNMNVQFFRSEVNSQGSTSHTQKVSSFVQTTVSSVFGGAAGVAASTATQGSMNAQQEHKGIESTLVVAVTATHKKAQQFTDIEWDADKLVAAWNAKLPDDKMKLYGEGIKAMYKELLAEGDEGGKGKTGDVKGLQVLSGRTFGSSFIGFVHFSKDTSTKSFQSMQTSAVSASAQATYSNFFASVTGKFGMDAQSSNDVKSLLSSTTLQSHVSVITMGVMPSIASQNVNTAVKEFAAFSPDELEGKLNTLANGNHAPSLGMDSGAAQSIRAGQINGAQQGKIESVLTGVSSTDATVNKVVDTNSLMLALDDYIKNARAMEGGVPINFYISHIDKKKVISTWFKENRPELLACAIHGTASPMCRNEEVVDEKDKTNE